MPRALCCRTFAERHMKHAGGRRERQRNSWKEEENNYYKLMLRIEKHLTTLSKQTAEKMILLHSFKSVRSRLSEKESSSVRVFIRQKKRQLFIIFCSRDQDSKTVNVLPSLCIMKKVLKQLPSAMHKQQQRCFHSGCNWSINLLFYCSFVSRHTFNIWFYSLCLMKMCVCSLMRKRKEPGHKLQFQWIGFLLLLPLSQYQDPSSSLIPLTYYPRNYFGSLQMLPLHVCQFASVSNVEFIDFMANEESFIVERSIGRVLSHSRVRRNQHECFFLPAKQETAFLACLSFHKRF